MQIRKAVTFLFVLLTSLLTAAVAFAEEAASEGGGDGTWMKFFATALVIAIPASVGALAQSRTASTALEGIARNPNASGKIFTPMILGLALIESLVIYALIIAFMLVGKY
ncbi:MAG: ATP synthase F0 subunit C [Myxococcota bacterium]|nr:ATP synthase F0 subunit C [Myxococcota bacterium]